VLKKNTLAQCASPGNAPISHRPHFTPLSSSIVSAPHTTRLVAGFSTSRKRAGAPLPHLSFVQGPGGDCVLRLRTRILPRPVFGLRSSCAILSRSLKMSVKLVFAALVLAAVTDAVAARARATTLRRPLDDSPTPTERIPRNLQAAQYRWTTEHHDIQNTGNSGWIGPAEATGVCKTSVSGEGRRESLPMTPDSSLPLLT
jgi:hypothetical protein